MVKIFLLWAVLALVKVITVSIYFFINELSKREYAEDIFTRYEEAELERITKIYREQKQKRVEETGRKRKKILERRFNWFESTRSKKAFDIQR